MENEILFSPISVGGHTVKNRIVMPAMGLGYSRDGFVNEKWTRFYEERAEGGTGMIIIGGCQVMENTGSGGRTLDLSNDRYIPAMKEMVSRIKAHGTTVLAQIYHMGRSTLPQWTGGLTPVSSSPIASPWSGLVPRELSPDEIHDIIDAYARAALRAQKAGFDGIELHGASGYLIAQFLSSAVNQRKDEFGGDLEGRCRFGLELVKKIRKMTGKYFLQSFRLSGNEFMPGGQGIEAARVIAAALEKEGVDIIHITGGFNESPVPQINMAVPRAGFAYLAREVKEAVNIPVITCVRINTAHTAAQVLNHGHADMAGMGRALIADPYLPQKAMQGRLDDIRPCIGCNQGCMENSIKFLPVTCFMNPMAGRESEQRITPAAGKKAVWVIGGGPGGMEAAMISAQRGHEVSLFEKSSRLGGQMNLAHIPPGRSEFKHVITYLSHRSAMSGVTIHLNREVTKEMILEGRPDVVVIATGAAPVVPDLPGLDDPRVVACEDILEGRQVPGKKVIVLGGGAIGCETAHFMARMGTLDPEQFHFLARYGAENHEVMTRLLWEGTKDITLLEKEKKIGQNIGATSRGIILGELRRHGVKIIPQAEALALEPEGLKVHHDGEIKNLEADTVVIAVGVKAENRLAEALRGKVGELYLIGDAGEPGTAFDAIQQGFELGLRI